MIRHGLEDIEDVSNPLHDKLPKLIDYFVKVFGEQYRGQIESKLNNTIYIFSDRSFDKNAIDAYFEDLQTALLKDFIKSVGGNEDDVNLRLIESLKKLESWQKGIDEKDYQQAAKLLNASGFEIGGRQLKLYNFKRGLSDNEKALVLEFVKNLNTKYKEVYEADFDYLEKEKERLSQNLIRQNKLKAIEQKYSKLLNDEICISLMGRLDIEPSDENIEKLYALTDLISEIAQKDKNFFTQYDEKRFSNVFFQLQAMSGKNYEKVLQAIKSIKKVVLPLIEKRQEEIDKIELDYSLILNTLSLSNYEKQQLIDGLKGQKLECAGQMSTFKSKDGKDSKSFVIVDSIVNLDDEVLIHEMVHVVSQSFLGEYQKNGFQLDFESTKNTALNEVLTDYFAEKIYSAMKKDGFIIGGLQSEKSQSFYKYAFPLLSSFIKENYQSILNCYMSGDPDIIYKTFGEKQIEQLEKATEKLFALCKSHPNLSALGGFEFDLLDYESGKKTVRGKRKEFSCEEKEYIDCFRKVKEVLAKLELQKSEVDLEL